MTAQTHTLVDYDLSSLCESCKTLPRVYELFSETYQLHESLTELECCPCPFCKWLWRSVQEQERGRPPNRKHSLAEAKSQQQPVTFEGETKGTVRGEGLFQFRLRPVNFPEHVGLGEFFLYTLPDDPCACHINSGPYYSDHRADVAFARIQEWLHDCICNHPACGPSTDVELPTLTIDVGRSGTESKLRLVDNSSRIKKGRYIALSYIWGVGKEATVPDDPRKTTLRDLYLNKDNREKYSQEIPESRLPQTIQEAIFVTRKLGLRYLWVDALCIVQDDRAFKKKELLNMHHIYRNSYLTIRAACTETVFDSFLFKRPHPDIPDQRLAYWGDEYESAYAYLRCAITQDQVTIAYRAWCYEEEALPRRVLTYTSRTGMRFTCCVGSKDEGGLVLDFGERGGIVRSLNVPAWSRDIEYEQQSQNYNIEPDTGLDKLRIWYKDLDADYTGRLLTNPSDRLPAIAGVVREIQPSIGGVYVSGIWKADLPWGLLWWTRRPRLMSAQSAEMEKFKGYHKALNLTRQTTKSIGQYIGPSWSWATLNNHTLHQFLSRVTETIVCEVLQFPDEDDYLGDGLAPSVLKISARAALGYTSPISEVSHLLQVDDTRNRNADCMLKRDKTVSATSGQCKRFAVAKFDDLDEMKDHQAHVTCVFITSQVGIMLKPCEQFRGHYRRLGLFIECQGFYDDELSISEFSVI